MNKIIFFLLTGILFFSAESIGKPPLRIANVRPEDADMFSSIGLEPTDITNSSTVALSQGQKPTAQKDFSPQQERFASSSLSSSNSASSGSSSSSSLSWSLNKKSKTSDKEPLSEDEESKSEDEVKAEDEGDESSRSSEGAERKNVRQSPTRQSVSASPEADKRIKRILNSLKSKFKNYYVYFVEPQIHNDAGSSQRNPIKFKIASYLTSTLAEETVLSTAYAAFFCRGAPANTWVSFSTFMNKTTGYWSRLGFSLFASPDNIRAITKTVTTDCGNMYGKMCLQDACQSGLCGFPQLEMLGAVCGLCHEKGGENSSYDLGTRRCQIDYIDTFIKKIGAHEYNKTQRKNQPQNLAYYQDGHSAPASIPQPSPNSWQNNPAPWGQPPIQAAPYPSWIQGRSQSYQTLPPAYGTYGPPPSYRPPYGY